MLLVFPLVADKDGLIKGILLLPLLFDDDDDDDDDDDEVGVTAATGTPCSIEIP